MQIHNLNHLFMQAPVAICIVSGSDYRLELVNERMLEFLGRTPDIVGMPIEQTLTEARKQGLIAILDTVRQTRQPYYARQFPSIIIINGSRESRYFDLVFKPYFLNPEDAEPKAIFCVAHNVTEQVLINQKLEEEKQRTSLALEVGELGMLSTNWKNNSVTADRRSREIFEVEQLDSIGDYLERIHPDDRSLREKAVTEGNKTGSFDFEVRLLVNNNIKWIRSRGFIQKDIEGNIIGSFGIIQDITAQKEFAIALHKKVEEQVHDLEFANKSLLQVNDQLKRSNAALEEFARVASHDLKEPIRKVHFFMDHLRTHLEGRLNDEEETMFNRVENAAERMKLLVDDLLEYSHLNQSLKEKEDIDLNKKIELILSDLELLIKEKDAEIEVQKLPVIKGYRRQLQQLFQNLVGNALKYSRPAVRPVIKISCRIIKGKEAQIRLPENLLSQLFYCIEVSDNGIGFEQENADRIFNVFTRLHGNKDYPGTGIGLSIAKKVMENHNGFIYAKGEVNQGAVFNILFPIQTS